MLKRVPSSLFDRGAVWTIKGKVTPRLIWESTNKLIVNAPTAIDTQDVVLQTTRWYDVEIVYTTEPVHEVH